MLLLFIGCGPADCPEGSALEDDGLCYLEEAEDTTATDPTLTELEAIEALQIALAVGLPEPMGLAATYDAVLQANSDTGCPFVSPPSEEGSEGGVWAGDCTADGGWRFSGQSLYLLTTSLEDGVSLLDLEMASSFEMTAPEGVVFQGGGEVAFERVSTGSAVSYEGHIGGLYGYPSADNWLADVNSAALIYTGSRDDDGSRLTLDGGVGMGEQIIDFIDLTLDTGICDGAPSGEIGIRDGTGLWYELTLDCDTCGTLSWRGEALSVHCIELSAPLEDLLAALEDA